MYLHEGLRVWSQFVRDTFTKRNIIDLREILRSEDADG